MVAVRALLLLVAVSLHPFHHRHGMTYYCWGAAVCAQVLLSEAAERRAGLR